METSLLLIRFALAALFATAGVAKFFDPPGTEKAIIGFGIPATLARQLRSLLPLAEMLIAISLLFVDISWFGAIGAAAILVAFTVAMVIQFSKGNAPDCHCFGQIHSEPVGLPSILRNIALIALAGFLIYAGPTVQGGDVTSTPLSLAIVFGFALLFCIGVAAILYLKEISTDQQLLMRRVELLELIGREGGEVEREDLSDPNEGLPIGAMLPEFTAKNVLDGSQFSSSDIFSDSHPTLMLFVSPTCNPCQALLPEIEGWIEEFNDRAKFVFVTTGNEKENRDKFASVDPSAIILQKEREIAESVNAFWTPTGLLVDGSGRIASRLAPGDNSIRELVDRMRTDSVSSSINDSAANGHGPKHRIGEQIPEFAVTDVEGADLTHHDLISKRSLVLFWSTTCPYCTSMIDDLVAWETSRIDGDPEVLVFADGDATTIANLPFGERIVHDAGHKVSSGFGMYGTPSAVLVDESGTIVSETATGAPNIWSLVGRKARSAT